MIDTDQMEHAEDFNTHEADFACPDCGRPLESQFSYGDHVECFKCGAIWEVTVTLERK